MGSWGTVCWIQRYQKCHEYLITLETQVQGKTMNNKSFSYVTTLTSLAIWGPGGGEGWLNNQTGSILVPNYPLIDINVHVKYVFNNQTVSIFVHIYPLIYINLHVKYGGNLIRTFWVKIENIGTKKWGTKMSANVDLITLEIYGQENILTISFSYMGQMSMFGYLGALGRSALIRLGLCCFPAIFSPISMYM